MLKSLLVSALLLTIISCKDYTYTRSEDVEKLLKTMTHPELDYKAMVTHYDTLPPAERKVTERIDGNYKTLSECISLMPTLGYGYSIHQAAFDKKNAVSYATFYSTASSTINPDDIVDKPVLLMQFVQKTDTIYLLMGKICPPPPNCEYE